LSKDDRNEPNLQDISSNSRKPLKEYKGIGALS
jgi:hypothetical protein